MPYTDHYVGLGKAVPASLPGTGVLLVNLGTPTAATAEALRPYLAQFLSDPRVIELPRWRWWPILHGVLLRTRPKHSAAAYRRIWSQAGSPLRVLSEALRDAVAAELAGGSEPLTMALAMRYGEPGIARTIAAMQTQGMGRLIVLPMYPQYSATSFGSVVDAVADAMKALRWTPELTVLGDYHAQPGYLDALAASVREHWQQRGHGERLLISFHGIPAHYARAGDPYPRQCEATAQGLRERLGLDEHSAPMSYQSRLGRAPWLGPYTDHTVAQLARDGVKQLDVICPGFAVDCLETLGEIAIDNGECFRTLGGEELRYIGALNSRPEHVRFLCGRIRHHLG